MLRRVSTSFLLSAFILGLVSGSVPARADEGMWTLDNLPKQQMKGKYQFEPTQEWLEHARLSALRFPGGSGSFISSKGLVLTNHHVAHHWIQSVSSDKNDYVKDGFVSKNLSEEIKVPGLVLYTLMEMENVTGQKEEAIKAKLEKPGLHSERVSLYQGGQQWIYRFKKHEDVRLVMAPEYDVAAFGKDWDNFSWTRHDLDFTIFRIYENDQPFQPKHHLAWDTKGVSYGDMTFTIGHPGRTSRMETLAMMQAKRDVFNPLRIRSLDRSRKRLHAIAAQGESQARNVSAQIMGTENSYKVATAETMGLNNNAAMTMVEKRETELRAKVQADPPLKALAGDCWNQVKKALETQKTGNAEFHILSRIPAGPLRDGLWLYSLTLEKQKPEKERSQIFQGKAFEKRMELFLSPAKTDAAKAQGDLEAFLQEAVEELGPKHALVQSLLQGQSPTAAAKTILSDSQLSDIKNRKTLLEGDAKVIFESPSPVLKCAKTLVPVADQRAKDIETSQKTIQENLEKIAKARFAVYGTSTYPDANFTLRLSYGAVETYPHAGTLAQPFTTFAGLFDRAAAWGPKAQDASWVLPPRWVEGRDKLNLFTPYNFITTNDIIGGNSGSPVINRDGALIGLAFDGNIESNAGRYYYDAQLNRTLCVDGRAILEVLNKLYDAKHLVNELTLR